MRTQREEKTSDFLLKQDNQRNDTYAHQLVEDVAQQLHLQNLRHHNPCHNEHQHTIEDVQRARRLHQSPCFIQQHGHQQNVDNILYAKFKHNSFI